MSSSGAGASMLRSRDRRGARDDERRTTVTAVVILAVRARAPHVSSLYIQLASAAHTVPLRES